MKSYWKVTPRVNLFVFGTLLIVFGAVASSINVVDRIFAGYIIAGFLMMTCFKWEYVERINVM